MTGLAREAGFRVDDFADFLATAGLSTRATVTGAERAPDVRIA
jgi:hypothetical protein